MSILIFASVVSRLPAQGSAIWSRGQQVPVLHHHRSSASAMIVGIVFVESGQRRIPVQFAKRVVGRRMYGGQSTYIPLKVNQSGVIPVIFASSILSFPALIASALGDNVTGVQEWINDNLVNNQGWWYISFYTMLIIFFAYFYTAIAFNPQQQADIIRKQGGFIPGIRPGPPTERYLAKVLNRITLPGSLFLAVDRGHTVARVRVLGHQPVPVRRHRAAHHRGRRARDDEADRQPADDAQLRRLPGLIMHEHHGVHASCCSASRAPARARRPRGSSEHYGVEHLSTGDLFRAAVAAGHARRASRSKRYMDRGELVPDEIVIRVVDEHFAAGGPLDDGFVLDGFPRTLVQAEELERVLDGPPARPRARHRRAHRDRPRPHRRPAGLRELRRQLPRRTSRPRSTGPATCAAAQVVQRDDDTEEAVAAPARALRAPDRADHRLLRQPREARRRRRRRRRRRSVQERLVKEIDERFDARPTVITRKNARADRAHAPRGRGGRRDARGVHPRREAGRDHARRRRARRAR